jgi:hypothetical protein
MEAVLEAAAKGAVPQRSLEFCFWLLLPPPSRQSKEHSLDACLHFLLVLGYRFDHQYGQEIKSQTFHVIFLLSTQCFS